MTALIRTTVFISLLLTTLASCADINTAKNSKPVAVIETNQGTISLELQPKEAPITVANFIKYANSGHYNGTIFHRVIKGFMIQGGGFDQTMTKKRTQAPIKNESFNGLGNDKYTIAMARTNNPDSATAQFFINTQNNVNLNAMGERPGYAVFGRVIKGQGIVDSIENAQTTRVAMYADVPVEKIIIQSIRIK